MKDKGYYIPVLSYHAVGPNEWYYHNAQEFESHIKWLVENGYTGLSLEEYYNYWSGKITEKDLPEKPVFICFDDGRDSVYTHAFPVLKKYNMKFTNFIITDKVGDPDFITWKQLQEMVNSGLSDVGSHTDTHHYFELEEADGKTWGALAIRTWFDNGIYAYLNQGQHYPLKSYLALPIVGTAKNYDSGGLYPITSYLGFYANKSMMVDRIIMKCPTHIPSETYYDVKVRVSIGPRGDMENATSMDEETVINEEWSPRHEPVDLVNENTGETWVNGRFDVIYFNEPYRVSAGSWYNIKLETLNVSNEQQEMRVYIDPSLPFEIKNCATNSASSDYNVVNGWAQHHALPQIILSDGSGRKETASEYRTRVLSDSERVKRTLSERVGTSIQTYLHAPRRETGNGEEGTTAIPLFGASWGTATEIMEPDPETGEEKGTGEYTYSNWSRLTSALKLSFSSSFRCTKIKVKPVRNFEQQFSAICDVWIGPWKDALPEDPESEGFKRVRKGFLTIFRWPDYVNKYGELVIDFDKGTYFDISAGQTYCLLFKTLNEDKVQYDREFPIYDDEGNIVGSETKTITANVEGVFRIGGTWFNPGYEEIPPPVDEKGEPIGEPEYKPIPQGNVTGIWVSRAGDGEDEGKGLRRVCVNPELWFYSETSSYPSGKWEPPVWSIAFPFGSYTDETNAVQAESGMKMQFTIYSGQLDTRPNHNEAAVQDLAQIPRIMMVKPNSPPFPDLVQCHTFEKYAPTSPAPRLTTYAWVIEREWGCHSLRENWNHIDVAIFDSFNFGTDGVTIHGEPNPDWIWFKEKKKRSYAMFGNFGEKGFDPAISTAIFYNAEASTNAILSKLITEGWDGCSVDFEEVRPEDREAATVWFTILADKLHNNGFAYYELIVAAPYPFATTPSWAEWFDYAAIAQVSDRIVPMTYLDHGSWTEPGPISDFSLFVKRYEELLKVVPAHKLAGGLGVFGCVWERDKWGKWTGQEKNILELSPMMEGRYVPVKDPISNEWNCKIPEENKEIWFQAPDTFYRRIEWLYEKGIKAIAIWKLDDDEYSHWTKGFSSHFFKPNYPTIDINKK